MNIYVDITSRNGLQIDFEPTNAILSGFFRSLKKEHFPLYISELLRNKSFGVENSWITFYEEMDWEDKAGLEYLGGIKEGEVNIYLYDGKVNDYIMPKSLFTKIFYDYAQKLLEVYRADKDLPENWANEMESSLQKLKEKLKSESI